MSKVNQLIINDILFPTSTHDKYRSYPVQLSEKLEMIAGNMVEEVRGTVQKIEYTCDAISSNDYTLAMAALRKPGPLRVAYLPDDGSTELITSTFLIESMTPPTLSFYDRNRPYWHGLTLVLREVNPHA